MEVDLLFIAVVVTGVWNVTYTITSPSKRGPYDLLDKLREFFGVLLDYDYDSQEYIAYPGEREKWWHGITQAVHCFECTSIYVGVVATILLAVSPKVLFWAVMPFSVSGLVIIINNILSVLAKEQQKWQN